MVIAKLVWPAFTVGMVLMLRRAGAGTCCGGGNNSGAAEARPLKAAVGNGAGQHH
jgi:hypothetical protein